MKISPNCCRPTWFAPERHDHPNVLGEEPRPDQFLESGPPDDSPIRQRDLAGVVYQELARDPFVRPRPTTGQRTYAQARAYRGQRSGNLLGQLPRFQAAGGQDRNCADFVSSVQQNSGRLKHHYIGVPELRSGLIHEGWRPIPAAQARPGDVWISSGQTHTEVVAAPGGTRLIGSNNSGRSYQTITEHPQNPANGTYWSAGR